MGNRVPDARRRGLIKRGALGAAAVAALVAVGNEARAATIAPDGGKTIRLLGRGWHSDANGTVVPGKGDRYAVYGELTDPSGTAVGEFYASCVAVDSPFQVTGAGVGSLEIHTLVLTDGSIVGIGAGGGIERSFAVVGGTGRYAGARGSYTARQDTYGLGGTGVAEILLTLL